MVTKLWVWQLGTYMFLHGGLFHILFNMLALWMFGAELERIWGTRYFLKFYFVTGIGAGILTVLVLAAALSPPRSTVRIERHRGVGRDLRAAARVRRSTFPDRPIYMYFVFPIPAKYLRDDHGSDRFLRVVRRIRVAASPTPRTSADSSSPTVSEERAHAIRSAS